MSAVHVNFKCSVCVATSPLAVRVMDWINAAAMITSGWKIYFRGQPHCDRAQCHDPGLKHEDLTVPVENSRSACAAYGGSKI
jgi:hypothetical protein